MLTYTWSKVVDGKLVEMMYIHENQLHEQLRLEIANLLKLNFRTHMCLWQ